MSQVLKTVRISLWVLLLVGVGMSVGCHSTGDSEGMGDGDDYARTGLHRGGSVSPARLNARPGYLNS